MTYTKTITAGLLALGLSASPGFAETIHTGVTNFTHDAPHRDRLVQTTLFYPGTDGGYPEWIGDNPVFNLGRLHPGDNHTGRLAASRRYVVID